MNLDPDEYKIMNTHNIYTYMPVRQLSIYPVRQLTMTNKKTKNKNLFMIICKICTVYPQKAEIDRN